MTSTALPSNDKQQLAKLIADLESARGSKIITYWLTDLGRMSEAAVPTMYDQLNAIGRQKALDLFLYTRGGDTEIPLRFVSLIREFCDRFAVLIPYRAYSAGTLLALGADEIVMTPLGVLGPIDPSRTHPLLPRREGAAEAEPISVQDMRHAMRWIFETAKPQDGPGYTAEAIAQIITALFEKIHPLAIGAIEQSYALAKLIGIQCLSTHMDPVKDKAQIEAIVNRLCDDYKSHAYQISRREAQDIGLNVTKPSAAIESAMMALLRFYLGRNIGVPPNPGPGQRLKLVIAWMDSGAINFRVDADAAMGQGGKVEMQGDRWVKY